MPRRDALLAYLGSTPHTIAAAHARLEEVARAAGDLSRRRATWFAMAAEAAALSEIASEPSRLWRWRARRDWPTWPGSSGVRCSTSYGVIPPSPSVVAGARVRAAFALAEPGIEEIHSA